VVRLFQLRRTLEEVFGFDEFRPGQLDVIRLLVEGQSALALFPTGRGKSLTYQLPALHFDGVTVVVSPLISLMKDQVDACRARRIPAARIDSSVGPKEAARVLAEVAAGRIKLLYVAPERCATRRFQAALAGVEVSLLAIDEAHTISQWGAMFRPELLRLPEVARRLGAKRVLALTATATPEVVDDISQAFGIPTSNRVIASFHRPNLRIEFEAVGVWDRHDALLRVPFDGPSIVYASYQKSTEELATFLSRHGHDARAYHAGLTAAKREEIQTWFKGTDRGIVVSTVAFGMGVDKADIRFVVHFNLPRSLEGYCQEIGRAGRDGQQSICRLLACLDDVPGLRNFAYVATPPRHALDCLVANLFSRGDRFRLDAALVADACDVELPVFRTILWYLEQAGYVVEERATEQEYRIEPSAALPALSARFDGDRRAFLDALFSEAWPDGEGLTIDVELAARRTGQPRERVLAALEYLCDKELIDLIPLEGAAELRVVKRPKSLRALASALERLFTEIERRDLARLDDVVAFVAHDGCHTARLLEYFGETLPRPCGHCTHCLTGAAVALKARGRVPRLPYRSYVEGFRAKYPEALADARSTARFLFGYPSRLFECFGLVRHPAYGAMRREDFGQILAWLEKPFRGEPEDPAMLEAWALGDAKRVEITRKLGAARTQWRETRRRGLGASRR